MKRYLRKVHAICVSTDCALLYSALVPTIPFDMKSFVPLQVYHKGNVEVNVWRTHLSDKEKHVFIEYWQFLTKVTHTKQTIELNNHVHPKKKSTNLSVSH